MKSSIRKMLTAAGGPMKKIKTRDINGNWVYMDISTGRTTSAGPETGTIRTNTVNSVGGDVKTKQGRTKIALKQATSYNNRLYKVHNYADTTMRLKLKHQDVVLDKQGEPKIILTDYTPALEAPMLIVSPEFDVLTLGRQAATSMYKAAKPTTGVSSEIYYHGSPRLGLTTLEPQNGLLWVTDSKSGATLYGGGITGKGSLYKINNIDLGDNILTVNGKFHSPFKVPLKGLPEDVLKYLPKDKYTYIDRIADAAKLAGYSSVLFKNVLDFGGKGASINPFHSYMYKQTAIFNPVNITSEFVSPISRLKFKQGGKMNILLFLKNGNKIHIKKKNRGKFTDYCGGKVTDACIRKAKASGNPTLVKRATFAANARKWKHAKGGILYGSEGMNLGYDMNQEMDVGMGPELKKNKKITVPVGSKLRLKEAYDWFKLRYSNVDWNNMNYIYNLFKRAGIPYDTTIAVMGNIVHESLGNPRKRQIDGGPGYGLLQWNKGTEPGGTLVAQTRGIISALKDPASQSNYWYHGGAGSGFKTGLDAQKYIMSKNNYNFTNKTKVFSNSYLRPGKPHLEDRVKSSRLLARLYKEYNKGGIL